MKSQGFELRHSLQRRLAHFERVIARSMTCGTTGYPRGALAAPNAIRQDPEPIDESPSGLFYAGLAIQGGVPIMYQNECVGAIGVSGVQSQDDEKIARAGVSALE